MQDKRLWFAEQRKIFSGSLFPENEEKKAVNHETKQDELTTRAVGEQGTEKECTCTSALCLF